MENGLGCRFLPYPKRGGELATTLRATPAALPIVRLQVLQRERMPLAGRIEHTGFTLKRASEQLMDVGEAHDPS